MRKLQCWILHSFCQESRSSVSWALLFKLMIPEAGGPIPELQEEILKFSVFSLKGLQLKTTYYARGILHPSVWLEHTLWAVRLFARWGVMPKWEEYTTKMTGNERSNPKETRVRRKHKGKEQIGNMIITAFNQTTVVQDHPLNVIARLPFICPSFIYIFIVQCYSYNL